MAATGIRYVFPTNGECRRDAAHALRKRAMRNNRPSGGLLLFPVSDPSNSLSMVSTFSLVVVIPITYDNPTFEASSK